MQTLTGHTAKIYKLTFNPDGTRLVTVSADRTAKVWETTTGQELLTLAGHTIGPTPRTDSGVTGVTFSPDGTRLATASDDGTARIWDAATGQELLVLVGHAAGEPADAFGGVIDVAFSPDGKYLVTSGNDETIRIWDATTGHELLTLPSGIGDVRDIEFSPNGSRLAMGSWSDGATQVWKMSPLLNPDSRAQMDSTAGPEGFILTGQTSSILGLAFSPDGSRLATASEDSTIKVWDAETGEELLTLTGDSMYLDVAFSPDGNRLIAASGDGTAGVYVLPVEELVDLAKSRVTRSLTTEECQQFLHLDECPKGL